MQSVSSQWTAEETDTVRRIIQSLQVSWKKDNLLNNRTLTIGVSLIGGNDIIGANPGAIGSPGNYRYFDESDYVTGLSWERGLNIPQGGISIALAEAKLDNTSHRFTPRYMGGHSELFTSILPRRPILINAGFNFNGIDQAIPQFAGILNKNPAVDVRSGGVSLNAADYVNFFSNRYTDRTAMYTGVTVDTIMEAQLINQGLSTSQYDLDPGINPIPFVAIDRGVKLSQLFNDLAASEYGHFFQTEEGIFKFKNRQWGDTAPDNAVQRIITTAMVINNQAPDVDHIINVVEIKSDVRQKAVNQKLWDLASPMLVPPNGKLEIFADFTDSDGALPVLDASIPAYAGSTLQDTSAYATNLAQDNSGDSNNSAIYVKSFDLFATAAKIIFQNTSNVGTYITAMQLWGRPAKKTSEVYSRHKRDSSVTAYEEQPLSIDSNPFIMSQDWADSLAELLLEDFSEIDNIQKLTIRAMPSLQLWDLVSWAGRSYRIFDIKTRLEPSVGFVNDLQMLQRTIHSYFRIGISVVGGTDKIAP